MQHFHAVIRPFAGKPDGINLGRVLDQPAALMTSYNLLNGTHTSEHTGILNDILRGEFGYRGLVMTDWVNFAASRGKNKYPPADAGRVAMAGGELFMPGSRDDAKSIRAALERGALKQDRLRRNVSGVLRAIRQLKK
jgi:beta-glucosidase